MSNKKKDSDNGKKMSRENQNTAETNNEKVIDENLPVVEEGVEAPADNETTMEPKAEGQKDNGAAEAIEKAAQEAAKEIENLKKQVSDTNDKYIRLMAEFDNYKKRTSREYERQVDCANEKIMNEMIAVRENFERALKADSSKADVNSIVDGMKLIYSQFDTVLTKNGLETFAAVGEPFDPMLHNALMNMPKAGVPAEHIADIYERGYKLKGKVIKHAKVIISSGEPAEPKTEKNEESK